jgi:XTP/dITP diphosphohydrolase
MEVWKIVDRMPSPLLFATSNKNKLREFQEILGMPVAQVELELTEPQSMDVEEVVKEKAIQAYRMLSKPVLVEDTGLFVRAWNGFPGALVKWAVKSAGTRGIIKMLGGEVDRNATAKTAIAFYDGKSTHIFSGSIEGKISTKVLGKSGFGWDPIFIPLGAEKSFAEMGPAEKNKISMRSMALLKLKRYIDQPGA